MATHFNLAICAVSNRLIAAPIPLTAKPSTVLAGVPRRS